MSDLETKTDKTDAQKALYFFESGINERNGYWPLFNSTIIRALKLLALVEGGEHKVVPVNIRKSMLDAMDGLDLTGCSYRFCLELGYEAAIKAAPDLKELIDD